MKRLALMGAAKGPCVSARGIHRPQLRVSGLPAGARITARTDKGAEVLIQANGVHPLGYDKLEWIEVCCHADVKHMTVCEIVSGKAA